MNFSSPLEIYTTALGWGLYNTLYELFAITGLLYYPLLMVLYRNWSEPHLSQDDKPAATTSGRRMKYAVYSLILVFIVAVLPFKEIELNQLTYKMACTKADGSQVVKADMQGGDTGTTFDTTLTTANGSLNAIRIPFIYWLGSSLMSGINYAVMKNMRCIEDIKGLDMMLRDIRINDPALRAEYVQFANDCYWPSRSRFVSAFKSNSENYNYVSTSFREFLRDTRFGNGDPNFIGSHYYLQYAGFYKQTVATTCQNELGGCSFRADTAVPGWPYRQGRDNDSAVPGEWGRPFCDEWWRGAGNQTPVLEPGLQEVGLQQKLLASIEATVVIRDWNSDKTFMENLRQKLNDSYDQVTLDDEQIKDLIISRFVSANPAELTSGGGMGNPSYIDFNNIGRGSSLMLAASAGAGAGLAATGIAPFALPAAGAAVGYVGITSLEEISTSLVGVYGALLVGKWAAPMIQSIILMVIYGALLIYHVLSEYEVEAVLSALFLIMAIRFFNTIWGWADYLDARLFVSMYPSASLLGSLVTFDINRLLLDMLLTAMYIIGPMIFLNMVNLSRVNTGRVGSGIDSFNSTVSRPFGNLGRGLRGGRKK